MTNSRPEDNVLILTRAMCRAMIGGCACQTKTPEYKYHANHCGYKMLGEALEQYAEAEKNTPNQTVGADVLRLLQTCRYHLVEHNNEYQHTTPEDVVTELEEVIQQLEQKRE